MNKKIFLELDANLKIDDLQSVLHHHGYDIEITNAEYSVLSYSKYVIKGKFENTNIYGITDIIPLKVQTYLKLKYGYCVCWQCSDTEKLTTLIQYCSNMEFIRQKFIDVGIRSFTSQNRLIKNFMALQGTEHNPETFGETLVDEIHVLYMLLKNMMMGNTMMGNSDIAVRIRDQFNKIEYDLKQRFLLFYESCGNEIT